MTNHPNDVIVIAVPEGSDMEQRRSFLRELASRMSEYRPCVVLDCSRLSNVDGAKIHLVLCCLEEALKRNGDARLAGVLPETKKMFEATGAHRMFQIFASTAEAIKSFSQRAASLDLREESRAEGDRVSQDAA